MQQRVVLDGQRDALADVLAEPRVDRAGVAAAHHQVDPAVGQVLQHRVVLGDLHRVVGGDQRRGRGQDEPLGPRGDVAEHRRRRGRHERRVVVLAGREDVEADLLGLQRDGDHRLDPLVLGRRPAGGGVGRDVADGEDPELHGCAHPPRLLTIQLYRQRWTPPAIPSLRHPGDPGIPVPGAPRPRARILGTRPAPRSAPSTPIWPLHAVPQTDHCMAPPRRDTDRDTRGIVDARGALLACALPPPRARRAPAPVRGALLADRLGPGPSRTSPRWCRTRRSTSSSSATRARTPVRGEVAGVGLGLVRTQAGGAGPGVRDPVPAGRLPPLRAGPPGVATGRAGGCRSREVFPDVPGRLAAVLAPGRRGRPRRRARRVPARPRPGTRPAGRAARWPWSTASAPTARSAASRDFARAEGMSVRALQRLFAAYVGRGPEVGHPALPHPRGPGARRRPTADVDWARLAADLGYSDQAHLVRDFTATVGVPPTAYASGAQPSKPRPPQRTAPENPPDPAIRDTGP